MKNKGLDERLLRSCIVAVSCLVLITSSFSSLAYRDPLPVQNSSLTRVVEDDIDPVPRGRVTYPDNLSDPSNTADYLIITNNTFYYDAKFNLPTVIRNQPTVEITYPCDPALYYGKTIVIQGNATDPDKDRIESVHIWESYRGFFNDNISINDNHGNVSWRYKVEFPEPINAFDLYVIHAQVFDGEEYSDIASFNLVVNSDSYPPIAKALPEYQEEEIGDYAVFNGSESYDPNGDELTYLWLINGEELWGETVQYQFVETGLYEVTLNVSDGMLWDTDTCRVYVNETVPPPNNPPFAIGLPMAQIVELGDPACLDGSGSYDPDGDTLEYTWEFGDGTNGSGVNVTHMYNNTGRYTVILNVSDGRTYDTDICLVIVYDHTTFNNRLNELAHWRADYNGFDVAVVSVDDLSDWAEDPSNPDLNNDTTIKNFIAYVYNHWSAPHMSDNHVEYLLLVGDTPFVESHHVTDYVTDRWYGLLEGGDDIPEILIGRFSVDKYQELEAIAEKTIHYEQNPEPGDWHTNVLLAKGGWPPNTLYFYKHTFIKEILLELGGYDVSEVFHWDGGTADDISNVINTGTIMVNYCGHGGRSGWSCIPFGTGHINQLTNGYKLPIVMSVACHTGEFQYENDCFGEVFVNTPGKGAIAFYGASKAGGSPRYTYYALKSIFENFEYTVGGIIKDLIIQAINDVPNQDHKEYNLLGDPALDISGSPRYPNRPDLTLSHLDITISPESPTYNDEEITINATIHNIGRGAAENITLHFICKNLYTGNQHLIGEQTVSVIPPGSCRQVWQSWNISNEWSKNALIVQIDPGNTIDEAFELNNQAGVKVTILSDPTYVDDEFNESTPGWRFDHFDTIQDGIDSVIENGTVYVGNGTYCENIVIEKPIHLIGQDKDTTVIDGGGSKTVIEISSGWARISGFTIQNSGRESEDAGVYINTDHNTITNCIICNNNDGVVLRQSSHNSISNNDIHNNNRGIYIVQTSRNNVVTQNTISDNTIGIKIFKEFLTLPINNVLYHNNFFNNDLSAYDNCNNKNTWYNQTFEEGNYWSDYTEQHQTPHDSQPPYGIWDDPYNVSGRTPPNQDMYPFRFPNGWDMIPCDLDCDGDVDLSDLAQLLGHYGMQSGATYEDGDIDGDGDVDLEDLAILLAHYGYGTNPIPGDTDHDGDVDLSDLAQFLGYYGTQSGATWEMGDFDGDGDVDLSDLGALLANYGYGT